MSFFLILCSDVWDVWELRFRIGIMGITAQQQQNLLKKSARNKQDSNIPSLYFAAQIF